MTDEQKILMQIKQAAQAHVKRAQATVGQIGKFIHLEADYTALWGEVHLLMGFLQGLADGLPEYKEDDDDK